MDRIEIQADPPKDGLTYQSPTSMKSSRKPTYPSSSNKTNQPAEKFKALYKKSSPRVIILEESKSDCKMDELAEFRG